MAFICNQKQYWFSVNLNILNFFCICLLNFTKFSFLFQLSFFLIGVFTILMTKSPNFILLQMIALGMGVFDGCFISLLGPIAFDLCGQEGAGQAIGFLLGFCSIPLTIGPPIAGILKFIFHYNNSNNIIIIIITNLNN